MLYTRNAFFFRKYYKEEVAKETGWLDLNFVGSLHPDKRRSKTGFVKLIYENRVNLAKLFIADQVTVVVVDEKKFSNKF
jgi:hypothetical protein